MSINIGFFFIPVMCQLFSHKCEPGLIMFVKFKAFLWSHKVIIDCTCMSYVYFFLIPDNLAWGQNYSGPLE